MQIFTSALNNTSRDQFSAECKILSKAVEFARFSKISIFLQNLVLAGDKSTGHR